MKVIASTLYRRPEYTKQMMDGLLSCDGIEDYLVLFCVEPGHPEVAELTNWFATQHAGTVSIYNPKLLGCTANIKQALTRGFAVPNTDYVIVVEDDIVLHKDALKYFEWANSSYKDDKSVFSVCAYRRSDEVSMAYDISRNKWFTPWGWATWRDRWQEIRAKWDGETTESWDRVIQFNIIGDRYEIYPHLARSQNIGAELGTYCPSPEWHKENQFNPHGVWSIDLTCGQFKEIDI